jgi:hypothetical protein
LHERDHDEPSGLLGPLGGWLRRTFTSEGAAR